MVQREKRITRSEAKGQIMKWLQTVAVILVFEENENFLRAFKQ
jgi:hypothetical protein